MNCIQCNKEFTPKRADAKCCSPACKLRYNRIKKRTDTDNNDTDKSLDDTDKDVSDTDKHDTDDTDNLVPDMTPGTKEWVKYWINRQYHSRQPDDDGITQVECPSCKELLRPLRKLKDIVPNRILWCSNHCSRVADSSVYYALTAPEKGYSYEALMVVF